MFMLNLSIIFGASTSESPQQYHQVNTPSVQKSQITSVKKDLRLAMIEVELLEYNHTNRSFIKTGITQLFNASFSRLGTKDNVESGFLRQVSLKNYCCFAQSSEFWIVWSFSDVAVRLSAQLYHGLKGCLFKKSLIFQHWWELLKI